MAEPSISAQVADLLGEDISKPEPGLREKPKRLAVAQALIECPRGALIAAHDKGQPLALAVLADGTRVLLPDSCPHDGGLLSDGFVEGNKIVCARHGWEFDAHTGLCSHRPDVKVRCTTLPKAGEPADS